MLLLEQFLLVFVMLSTKHIPGDRNLIRESSDAAQVKEVLLPADG
jgi:hypothetical protein